MWIVEISSAPSLWGWRKLQPLICPKINKPERVWTSSKRLFHWLSSASPNPNQAKLAIYFFKDTMHYYYCCYGCCCYCYYYFRGGETHTQKQFPSACSLPKCPQELWLGLSWSQEPEITQIQMFHMCGRDHLLTHHCCLDRKLESGANPYSFLCLKPNPGTLTWNVGILVTKLNLVPMPQEHFK